MQSAYSSSGHAYPARGSLTGLLPAYPQDSAIGDGELIVNGNFDQDTTVGWVITQGADSFIASGGVGTMDSSSTGYASYAFTTVIGEKYEYNATIKAGSVNSGGFMAIRKADDTDASVNVVNVVQGSSPQGSDISNTISIDATATTTYLVIQGNNIANVIVDNLSVKLAVNLAFSNGFSRGFE